MIFSKESTHIGNSLVLYHPNGDKKLSLVPASIQDIVETAGMVTVSIRRQAPATISPAADPFSPYPHFPAKLYSRNLEITVEQIPLDWILCHFARFSWSEEHAVVLSLSRVRPTL